METEKESYISVELYSKLKLNYIQIVKKIAYFKELFKKSRLAFKRLLRNYLLLKKNYLFLRKHSTKKVRELIDTITQERYQIVFDQDKKILQMSKTFLDSIEMTEDEFGHSFYIDILFEKYLPPITQGTRYTEVKPFQFPIFIENEDFIENSNHIHPYLYFEVKGRLLADPKYQKCFYQLTFQDISAQVELNYLQNTDKKIIDLQISNFKLVRAMKTIEMHKIMLIYLTCSLFEEYSRETSVHLQRIREITYALASECKKMGMLDTVNYDTEEYVKDVSFTSVLHDIGKMGISRDLLYKESALTSDETLEMRNHPQIGAQYIQKIIDFYKDNEDFATYLKFLQIPYDIILHHHERWDGKGYPTGLKGEDIPIAARIVTVADTYDAIRAKRVYAKSRTHEEALSIILAETTLQFDPKVVEAFKNISPILEKMTFD
jgi:HD-GYP domain-containing protein (c-di-GMP phosphodiesterase class II)